MFFRRLPGRFVATGEQEWPSANFALFTGTPGPNRKAVCCYVLPTGQRVFAKLPLGLQSGLTPKYMAKAVNLRALAKRGFASFTLPCVLDYEPGYLLQTSVKPPNGRRATCFGEAHARCLHEAAGHHAGAPVLGQQRLLAHYHAADRDASGLARYAHSVRAAHQAPASAPHPRPKPGTDFRLCHGDFTPWKCWVGPEGLALYDVELALPKAPLLYDLFHFEVQQALLTTRQAAPVIRARVLAVARQHFAAVPAPELTRAWQLYLLHQVSTGALLYHAQPDWHPQINWLLNGWNALLTLELGPALEHRQLAIYDLLDYVQLLPQPGVLLKPRAANAYYPAPTADLDLLLTRPDTAAGIRFMQQFPLVQSAAVRTAAHMVSVDCLFADGSLLSVDLLHQLHRMDLSLLDAPTVLREARPAATGVFVPTLRADFTYTWLFYWLNSSDMPLGHLRYFQQLPTPQQRQFARPPQHHFRFLVS